MIPQLLSINSASKTLRKKGKILLIGECIPNEHGELVEKYLEKYAALSVCLEREHFNMVSLKLASILARIPISEIIVLTVDGSPHCIQLHFVIEEVEKIMNRKFNVKHQVIYKGKIFEIERESVKTARYLNKVEKLRKRRSDVNNTAHLQCGYR